MQAEGVPTGAASAIAARWQALSTRARRTLIAGAVLAGAASCLLLPAVPILIGVLTIAAAGLHAWSADLRPLVQPLLRVPVAGAARRHGHLAVIATAGVLLVASGFGGALLRGQLRGRWAEEERRQASIDEDVGALLDRARMHLAAGQIDDAELALLDAQTVGSDQSAHAEDVEETLRRVRIAKNPKAALGALLNLSNSEFSAFERGTAVPEALSFPERSLTARAVHNATQQLDEARSRRARL